MLDLVEDWKARIPFIKKNVNRTLDFLLKYVDPKDGTCEIHPWVLTRGSQILSVKLETVIKHIWSLHKAEIIFIVEMNKHEVIFYLCAYGTKDE